MANTYDPEIFVVNLKQDIQKRQHMIQKLDVLPFRYTFIEAVFGKELPQKYIDTIYDESRAVREFGRSLSRGEIGCALSHIGIYKKMVAENIGIGVVLEDDADIHPDFISVLNTMHKLPEQWEILLLGYYSNTRSERMSIASYRGKKPVTGSIECVRLVETAFGTHGYMITRSGAEKMLRNIHKIVKPIDHYTGTEHYLNMYAVRPRVVTLNETFKQMGCINDDRDGIAYKKSPSWLLLNKKKLANYLRGKNWFLYLKKLPARIKKPRKYY